MKEKARRRWVASMWAIATLFATALACVAPRVAESQEEIYVADPNTFSVKVYSRTASGNSAPLRVIAGNATGLGSPLGIAVDDVHGEIFVVSGSGFIVVHDRFANGNALPRRVVDTSFPRGRFSSPQAVALDLAHDEVIVADQGSLKIYGCSASGAATPLRVISGSATKFDNTPDAVAVDPARNEIYAHVPIGIGGILVVHRRTANGNAVPLRFGDSGGLVGSGIALDTVNGEVFVTDRLLISDVLHAFSLQLVAKRDIRGSATGVSSARGIAVDTVHDEVLVTDDAQGSISVFRRTDQGNVPPLRRIVGPASQLSAPVAIAVTTTPLDETRLVNISTRGQVGTGNNQMIGGLIVRGTTPKTVLLRGRGPSLGGSPFNIPGVLSDPLLRLFSGSTLIGRNNNWQDPPDCSLACFGAAQIVATGLDPCRPNPRQILPPPFCALESAILVTLPPGAYTFILSGVAGQTGVGLVEAFEVDDATTPAYLHNISTRGVVGNGNQILIGGVIIEGSSPKQVLVRGRGPSLGGAPILIPGVLPDPILTIFSGATPIAQNDNWQDPPSCSPPFTCGTPGQITGTGLDPCQPNPGETTPPPNCSLESAILITLPPGAYTLQITGVGGATGVGLVEIFEIPF